MNKQLIPVSGNQKIAFQCQQCSACCRHVENKVMLELYDVYQLALHFQSEGQSLKPEDICAQYAHPMPLEPFFPIFLLNSAGEDQHCIFLNGNHCSVYAHRPRACRMYPFTVDAGRRGKDFEYLMVIDVDISVPACCITNAVKSWKSGKSVDKTRRNVPPHRLGSFHQKIMALFHFKSGEKSMKIRRFYENRAYQKAKDNRDLF